MFLISKISGDISDFKAHRVDSVEGVLFLSHTQTRAHWTSTETPAAVQPPRRLRAVRSLAVGPPPPPRLAAVVQMLNDSLKGRHTSAEICGQVHWPVSVCVWEGFNCMCGWIPAFSDCHYLLFVCFCCFVFFFKLLSLSFFSFSLFHNCFCWLWNKFPVPLKFPYWTYPRVGLLQLDIISNLIVYSFIYLFDCWSAGLQDCVCFHIFLHLRADTQIIS